MLFCSGGGFACAAGYHLEQQVALPSVTGWDYLSVDAARRELFISNNSGILVIDVDTLQEIGTVPSAATWPGVGLVHGVAVADRLGRGFISRQMPPSIVTFDLESLEVLRSSPTDPGTDAIVYDPATERVFTFNGKQAGVHDVTAMDALSGEDIGRVELPGVPEYAVSDAGGHLYVNIVTRDELARIDARSLQITALWQMGPCRHPSALALDRAHRRLFAACSNRMMLMMSADTGEVLGSVPTGEGTDAAAFDPETSDVFASNGSGTLTVAHESASGRLTLLEQIRTGPEARTMALDTKTHRVFLVSARFRTQATPENPHGYPLVVPGSARLLVFGP